VAERPAGLGPVQLLVIAFEDGSFDGRILDELRSLRDGGAIRMIDLLFVAKGEDGEVAELETPDLSAAESAEFGALVGALLGFAVEGEDGAVAHADLGARVAGQNGSLLDPEGAWYLADAIPAGTAAAIALIEHRWAIPLRDAIESAGGHDLVDRWIHPADLAAIGAGDG
jgi:uncharacterized membrane protein